MEKTGERKSWEQDFRATYASLASDATQLRVRLPRGQLLLSHLQLLQVKSTGRMFGEPDFVQSGLICCN